MFDNLKAFIRQGRQANDIKQKPAKDSMLPTYNEYTTQKGPQQSMNACELKEQVLTNPDKDVRVLETDFETQASSSESRLQCKIRRRG